MLRNPENVVFGTGPLGLAVAGRLVSSGQGVRLVNRSGKADAPQGVEVVAADVADPAAARRVCEAAAVVFHCANGPWSMDADPATHHEGHHQGAAAGLPRTGGAS